MTKANHSGAFKGHRFSPEIVAYAVWSCFRFPLSLRDFEDLLAARGIITIKVALTQDGFLFGDCLAQQMQALHQSLPQCAQRPLKRSYRGALPMIRYYFLLSIVSTRPLVKAAND